MTSTNALLSSFLNLSHVQIHDTNASKTQTSSAPLPIISITGAMRKGKSFLLNYIANEGLFPVSNRGACTTGMRMEIASLSDEAQREITWHLHQNTQSDTHTDTQDISTPLKWCLVDVEGQGDIHINRDRDLMLSTLLLSTILLYNIQGYAPREEILRMLDLTVRTYEIMERNGLDLDASLHSSKHDIKFGHLNVVIRDYQYSLTREEVWHELFEMEVVPNHSDSSHQHILERNHIRTRLRKYFSGLHVWLLPQPTTDSSLLSQQESLHFSQISPAFHVAVSEMMSSVHMQIASFKMHSHGGNPFHLQSTEDIESFLKSVFSMLSHDSLRMTSLVSILEEKDADRSVGLLVKGFKREVNKEVLPLLGIEQRLRTLKNQFVLRLEYLLGESSTVYVQRSKKSLQKQLDVICVMQYHKNNILKTQNIAKLIDSLCKEALQMMDSTNVLTFHDNFDEIQQKLEDKLMEDPFVMELSPEAQEEEKRNLRWRLEPYRQIAESGKGVSGEQSVANDSTDLTVSPMSSIRAHILKEKRNITSSLPLHPDKLISLLRELNMQVNVQAQKLLDQKKASQEQLAELYPLVENTEVDMRQLNELQIQKQVQLELDRVRETTHKMLQQYDIYQFTEVDAFQVQLACFLDDILSQELQPHVFSLLRNDEAKELQQRIENMCREMYNYEADRNRNINAQAYARMLELVHDRVDRFEEELKTKSQELVPCNEKILSFTFDSLLTKFKQELREEILHSAAHVKHDDDGGNDRSMQDSLKMEVVLTPQQLDLLIDRFQADCCKPCKGLMEENVVQSKRMADTFFNTNFKGNMESLFVSMFADHEPSHEELKALLADCIGNFWSYSPPGGQSSLRQLPLQDVEEHYKTKIREEISALRERAKKDKEWVALRKQANLTQSNTNELLSVNRFLVEKVQSMKKELQGIEILKKENDVLRMKLKEAEDRLRSGVAVQAPSAQSAPPSTVTQPPLDSFMHVNSSCAICQARPIVGLRFQSSYDTDTNYCESCFLSRVLTVGCNEQGDQHRVYVNNDLFLPNVELLMWRLKEMGFTGETFFESTRDMIHKLVEHKGDFKSLVPYLMKKKGVKLPIFEQQNGSKPSDKAPEQQQDEFLQKRALLRDMGHLDDERNRQLLIQHGGNLTVVAKILSGMRK